MNTIFKLHYRLKTVKELRVIAKQSNIKGYYKLKKNDLITKIIKEQTYLLKEPGILDIIYEYAGDISNLQFDSNNIKTITQELIEKFGEEDNFRLVHEDYPGARVQHCYLYNAFAKDECMQEYIDNNYSGNNIFKWINNDHFADINKFKIITFMITFRVTEACKWKKNMEYFFNIIKSINGCKIDNINFILNKNNTILLNKNNTLRITITF